MSKIKLITWRGMMTKLLLAVYEVDSAARGNRADGFQMNAMVLGVSTLARDFDMFFPC